MYVFTAITGSKFAFVSCSVFYYLQLGYCSLLNFVWYNIGFCSIFFNFSDYLWYALFVYFNLFIAIWFFQSLFIFKTLKINHGLCLFLKFRTSWFFFSFFYIFMFTFECLLCFFHFLSNGHFTVCFYIFQISLSENLSWTISRGLLKKVLINLSHIKLANGLAKRN